MADQVKSQFSAIDGATVSEQRFDGSFNGHDVAPAQPDRHAARRVEPPDRADRASRRRPRAAGRRPARRRRPRCCEIADSFSGSAHHKTLVFVSTDGSSIGALGAKRFIQRLQRLRPARCRDRAEPAGSSQHPHGPARDPLVDRGAEHRQPARRDRQLDRLRRRLATPAGDEGPLDDLFRLALPAGLGEQGPLIEAGAAGGPALRRRRAAGRIRPTTCPSRFDTRHLRPVRARRARP